MKMKEPPLFSPPKNILFLHRGVGTGGNTVLPVFLKPKSSTFHTFKIFLSCLTILCLKLVYLLHLLPKKNQTYVH